MTRLPPAESSSTGKVTVGIREQVETGGTTVVPFRFTEEKTVHILKSDLLADCIHDVIIGKGILEGHGNLLKPGQLLSSSEGENDQGDVTVPLFVSGGIASMVSGSINGRPQNALADFGPKVLVMDGAYVRKIGVKIEIGPEVIIFDEE